ncbi:MAG: hypothetical protein COV52_01715 [Gammaproteobacteria bacterium CG11_big_fil_rev_8_21_14_0_20_46_22]|nr:MAG: hypothetical protein COW05_05610 [Gammaproteobacteria bacterium CG12_big_fil_rev_8_21_14_0_65_46_12]PIR11831.1 MAG: hypothetical protein COV52_01715 [Gammaproteobacteria bacterium CG11_big_fil_rev_8_21_14_0_20_46_22]
MTRIAAIQMCSSHNVSDNLATAKMLIAEAAEHGAKLIVLPEMFAIMGASATDKVALKEPYHSGHIQTFLAEQARNHSVWIVGGTIPISCEADDSRVRAASIVFNAAGNIVARYDKVHLFDVVVSETESYRESDTTEPGSEHVVVVDTPVGKLGLTVCYDLRFPEQFIALQKAGAEIIAVPSAFTVKTGEAHWALLTRARAVDTFCYVVGACQGGEHSGGRKTYGHSMIVDPWGVIQEEAPASGNAVIYSEINLVALSEIRKRVPVAAHREAASRRSETMGAKHSGPTTFGL